MRHLITFALLFVCLPQLASAQQSEQQKQEERQKRAERATKAATSKPLKPRADGLIPVNEQQTVLADLKRKRVVVKTKVCNRDTLLEMFICLTERKLHESVLVLDGDAIHVHTALLMIGAEKGSPATFRPKYKPSHGQEIDIFVNWKDKDGKKKRARAQDWIQNSVRRYHIQKLEALPAGVKVPYDELRYDTRRKELLWFGQMSDKQYQNLVKLSDETDYRTAIDAMRDSGSIKKMEAKFIFAGSCFYEDENFPRYYTAEGGYVVCLANLPEALLDINVPSSGSDGDLAYEAFTERIPPEGTEVTVELIPVGPRPSELKKKTAQAVDKGAAKAVPPAGKSGSE